MIAIVYYLFFALALGSALMVVFLRHAVYSALSLIVTMISIAGIFILINAQLAAFFSNPRLRRRNHGAFSFCHHAA